MVRFGEITQPKGQADLIFSFAGGAVRRIQEVYILSLREASRAFHDIRGDGNGRTTKLGGEPKRLFMGERAGGAVDGQGQLVCQFKGA